MTDAQPEVTQAVADNYYAQREFSAALVAYKTLAARGDASAWAYSRIGAILAQQGEYEAAQSALLQALLIDPVLPQAHSNLGNIEYARGNYAAALTKYQTAGELDPTNPLYQENLHAAYKRLGMVADAVAALKRAHRLQREQDRHAAKAKLLRQHLKGRLGCSGSLLLAALCVATTGLALLLAA